MGWSRRRFRDWCWIALVALGSIAVVGACSGSGNDTLTAAGGSGGTGGGATSCEDSLGCVGQPNRRTICDPASHQCVECTADPDCIGGKICVESECRTPCDSDNDCTPIGLLCDHDAGFCGSGAGSGGSGGDNGGSGGNPGDGGSADDGGAVGSGGSGGTNGSGGSGGTAGMSGSGGSGGTGCLPPNVLLLLDRSHSTATTMIGSVTRLQAVKDALQAVVPIRTDVRFGLNLSQGSDAACAAACTTCTAGTVFVDPSDTSAGAVTTLLDAVVDCSSCGSPNAESFVSLGSYAPLQDLTRDNYVVLIVDGLATCADPVPAISALATTAVPPVKTFVVLLGGDVTADQVAPLAVAGGTSPLYNALLTGDLELIFNDIADQVACP